MFNKREKGYKAMGYKIEYADQLTADLQMPEPILPPNQLVNKYTSNNPCKKGQFPFLT
jgi:hypothetical protein